MSKTTRKATPKTTAPTKAEKERAYLNAEEAKTLFVQELANGGFFKKMQTAMFPKQEKRQQVAGAPAPKPPNSIQKARYFLELEHLANAAGAKDISQTARERAAEHLQKALEEGPGEQHYYETLGV